MTSRGPEMGNLRQILAFSGLRTGLRAAMIAGTMLAALPGGAQAQTTTTTTPPTPPASPTAVSALGTVLGDGNSSVGGICWTATTRMVVFHSAAANLDAADTNTAPDIYRADVATGAVRRVSVGAAGQGTQASLNPSASADCNLIAFESRAPELTGVAAPATGTPISQVLLKNMTSGALTLLSQSAGGPGNRDSTFPSIAADGTKVLFLSRATNLAAAATTGWPEALMTVPGSNSFTLVSGLLAGTQANNAAAFAQLAADGKSAVWVSVATNLVTMPAASTIYRQVYRRQFAVPASGTTAAVAERVDLVSLGPGAVPGLGHSSLPKISGDGKIFFFDTDATNLSGVVPGARNVVYKTALSTFAQSAGWPSINFAANFWAGQTGRPVSDDGRYVVMRGRANFGGEENLVVRDLKSGRTAFVDTSTLAAAAGNNAARTPIHLGLGLVMSGNGQAIAFDGVPVDRPPFTQVFVVANPLFQP